MRKREELIGSRFGKLLVIEFDEEKYKEDKRNRGVYSYNFICKCDCGKEVSANTQNLKSGKSTSCGCSRIDNNKKIKNITNNRYGRLVVLDRNKEISILRKRSYWNCKCDCGNDTLASLASLENGCKKSCGCLHRESSSISNKRNGIEKNGTFKDYVVSSFSLEYFNIIWSEQNTLRPEQLSHSTRDRIKLNCEICGETYEIATYNFTNGNQRHCWKNKSKGEVYIEQFLISKNIIFEKQKSFEDLRGLKNGKLRYDFYIPKLRLIIEVDGIQHREIVKCFGGEEGFKKRTTHDSIKNKYAKNIGFTIIRLEYEKHMKEQELIDMLISNPIFQY